MLMPLHRRSVKQTAYGLGNLHCCLHSLTAKRLKVAARTASVDCSKPVAAAADTPQHTSPPALLQSKDSWSVLSQTEQLPRVLLIDGTNLACICTGSKHSRHSIFNQPIAERFSAWIDFLQAVTASDTIVVAFDNKGSAGANVRALLAPKYLSKRYRSPRQQGTTTVAPGASLDGWAHLGFAIKHRQQCVVVHAAHGYEADDVLAAAAKWAAHQLQPRPHVLVASSDSDMQQLLDSHTYWLELLQVVSKQFPSGVQLHSQQSFERQHSFPPATYPAFLSLVGKPAASIPGVGISAKLAKTLIARFGSVDAILVAGESNGLKPFGVADKLLGSGPQAAANRQAAATSMAVLSLHAEQQKLPEPQLLACYEAAVAAWESKRQLEQEHTCHQEPQHDVQQQHQQQQQSVAALACKHPAVLAHMQQCQVYLKQLSHCLTAMGLPHKVGWVSPDGLQCDVLVDVHRGSSSGSSSGSLHHQHLQRDAKFDPQPNSERWLVVQVLGPGDLHGSQPPVGTYGSYEEAVDQLAQQLSSSCGCLAHSRSVLGHPKRNLMSSARGSAKRQLSLLKGAGWKVAVVPFYELHLADGEGAGPSATAAERYVTAMLQEQCGESLGKSDAVAAG